MPAARAERRQHGSRFGDFEIIRPLASGGMSGVYLAKHVISGAPVALKVLDLRFANHSEVIARLYSECAISQRAVHPGLVAIHAAAKNADGIPYLVMEYLEGRTLAQVHRGGKLPAREVAGVGAQVAAALSALHVAGIVHCDIKPENLFVLSNRAWGTLAQVKVIDYGVSRLVDEPPPDEASIAGTPAYMPPEQWRGMPVPASDVYALGCVLYELVTGEPPFEGSLAELVMAHLDQRPARPSWLCQGLPLELERLILRALAKDVALRPTMAQLATSLGDLVEVLDREASTPDEHAVPMSLAV